MRDVVTLASMVEKEAAVDDERPLIASVFLNRLRDPAFHPKRLECDPTASYGCLVAPEKAASCAGFTGKATAAIEHDPDNPYSTYTHEGLPPAPSPTPARGRSRRRWRRPSTHYFYFVAKGDGHTHVLGDVRGARHRGPRDEQALAGRGTPVAECPVFPGGLAEAGSRGSRPPTWLSQGA